MVESWMMIITETWLQTTCESFFYQTKVSLISITSVKCHKSQVTTKEKRKESFQRFNRCAKTKETWPKKDNQAKRQGQCFSKVIGSGFYEDNPLDLTILKRLTIIGMMYTCHCGWRWLCPPHNGKKCCHR